MKRLFSVCLGVGVAILGVVGVLGETAAAGETYKLEELDSSIRLYAGDKISLATYPGYGVGQTKEWIMWLTYEWGWEYRDAGYPDGYEVLISDLAHTFWPYTLRSVSDIPSDLEPVAIVPIEKGLFLDISIVSPIISSPSSLTVKKGETAKFETGIDPEYLMWAKETGQVLYQWYAVNDKAHYIDGFVDDMEGTYTIKGDEVESGSLSVTLGDTVPVQNDMASFTAESNVPMAECEATGRGRVSFVLEMGDLVNESGSICPDLIRGWGYIFTDADIPDDWLEWSKSDVLPRLTVNVEGLLEGDVVEIYGLEPMASPTSRWHKIAGETGPELEVGPESPYYQDGTKFLMAVKLLNYPTSLLYTSDMATLSLEKSGVPEVPAAGSQFDGAIVNMGVLATLSGVIAGVGAMSIGLRRIRR